MIGHYSNLLWITTGLHFETNWGKFSQAHWSQTWIFQLVWFVKYPSAEGVWAYENFWKAEDNTGFGVVEEFLELKSILGAQLEQTFCSSDLVGVKTKNSSGLKKFRGWWGCVASGTTETIKCDPGSLVLTTRSWICLNHHTPEHCTEVYNTYYTTLESYYTTILSLPSISRNTAFTLQSNAPWVCVSHIWLANAATYQMTWHCAVVKAVYSKNNNPVIDFEIKWKMDFAISVVLNWLTACNLNLKMKVLTVLWHLNVKHVMVLVLVKWKWIGNASLHIHLNNDRIVFWNISYFRVIHQNQWAGYNIQLPEFLLKHPNQMMFKFVISWAFFPFLFPFFLFFFLSTTWKYRGK